MAIILRNNTERAIMFGEGGLLIPAKPAKLEIGVDKLKADFPIIGSMIDSGHIEILRSDEAKQAEKDLEASTVSELKEYAEGHSIDVSGMTKKDDILAAIQKAKK